MHDVSIADRIETAQSTGANPGDLLRSIVSAFDAQSGTIHRIDESGQLTLVSHIGVPEIVMDKVRTIPVGKGIAGLAALERRPVTICNIKTDNSGVVGAKARLTGMEGAIAVPILVAGELRGTLGIGKNSEYTWTDAETREIEKIAGILANVL